MLWKLISLFTILCHDDMTKTLLWNLVEIACFWTFYIQNSLCSVVQNIKLSGKIEAVEPKIGHDLDFSVVCVMQLDSNQ